jgi:hypothetical protein
MFGRRRTLRDVCAYTDTPMAIVYKLTLDKGKRLDEFGYGYRGIMSRVKPGKIVVCAVGTMNTMYSATFTWHRFRTSRSTRQASDCPLRTNTAAPCCPP